MLHYRHHNCLIIKRIDLIGLVIGKQNRFCYSFLLFQLLIASACCSARQQLVSSYFLPSSLFNKYVHCKMGSVLHACPLVFISGFDFEHEMSHFLSTTCTLVSARPALVHKFLFLIPSPHSASEWTNKKLVPGLALQFLQDFIVCWRTSSWLSSNDTSKIRLRFAEIWKGNFYCLHLGKWIQVNWLLLLCNTSLPPPRTTITELLLLPFPPISNVM